MNGNNVCADLPNKVDSQGRGYIVSRAMAWRGAVEVRAGLVKVTPSTGEVLSAPLAKGWDQEALELLGALEGLVKACKQCASNPAQRLGQHLRALAPPPEDGGVL